MERLTTLSAVKDYLGIPEDNTDSDRFLTRLIDAASQFVLNWVDRDSFGVRSFTQNFNGNGKSSVLLANWPVQTVTSVGTGGSFVPASVFNSAGYPSSGYAMSDKRFGPQTLDLYGFGFGGPTQVIYTAGFRTTETDVIPATPFQVTPVTDGRWIADIKTTIDGVDAVKVAADPVAGQYSIDGWGVYTFAAADEGKTAVITYDYAPFDVSFAVDELIGEWYKRKDRIGVLSRTLGGQETITFSQKDMSDSIKSVLQPYCNVVPM
jgi:hypothetical protein